MSKSLYNGQYELRSRTQACERDIDDTEVLLTEHTSSGSYVRTIASLMLTDAVESLRGTLASGTVNEYLYSRGVADYVRSMKPTPAVWNPERVVYTADYGVLFDMSDGAGPNTRMFGAEVSARDFGIALVYIMGNTACQGVEDPRQSLIDDLHSDMQLALFAV